MKKTNIINIGMILRNCFIINLLISALVIGFIEFFSIFDESQRFNIISGIIIGNIVLLVVIILEMFLLATCRNSIITINEDRYIGGIILLYIIFLLIAYSILLNINNNFTGIVIIGLVGFSPIIAISSYYIENIIRIACNKKAKKI